VNGFLKYLIIERDTSSNTIVKYKSDLYNLCTFLYQHFKISDFEQVKIEYLRDYLAHIKINCNLKTSSLSNKISVIKSFFRYLYTSKIINDNPTELIRLPKKSKTIPKFLNDIELAKLLSAPERVTSKIAKRFIIRDRLILTMLAYTGLRKSELLNLDWDDVNLGLKYLIVRNTKNRIDRTVPLHSKISELLDSYLTQRLPITNKAIIIGKKGTRLSKNSLDRLFKKYLKMSNLSQKGYTLHSLRHTFATRLLRKNVSLVKIKNLLGHKSIESTEIYLHTTGKELEDSINLL